MVNIPVSVGELIDKITILKIKLKKIIDADKLKNIEKELNLLENIFNSLNLQNKVKKLQDKLYDVNSQLWDIEDRKRQIEVEKNFNDEFIRLARDVYLKNDKRALIKKEINLTTGSGIIEEKSYF